MQAMKDILQDRKIILTNEEDEVIWAIASSRNYSVKLGYGIQIVLERNTNWS